MPDEAPERRLLAGCDADQRAAITTRDNPLLVLAGAGAGKTRVLTRRIAWRIAEGSVLPEHVLALTFTRKAAAELRARLAALGIAGPVTAGTFHAVALRELRRRDLDAGRRPPVMLAAKSRLLAELLTLHTRQGPTSRPPASSRRPPAPSRRPPARRELIAELAGEIEWAAARLVGPADYPGAAAAAGRETILPAPRVAELMTRYALEKRRRGVLDFEDLLSCHARLIAEDTDFAAVQRWRYRHLFVDELQDLNAAQLAMLDAFLGAGEDLCAVGDGRQAIYGWNGAEADAVGLFTRRFPAARVIELATNYRSTPQVVAVASAALPRRRQAWARASAEEESAREALAGPEATAVRPAPAGQLAPVAARPDGRVPTLRCFEDEEAEAGEVSRRVRLAHGPGRRWSDCAVLARTNAQLVVLERALVAAGIPTRVASAEAFLDRPAVRHALDALRARSSASAFSSWLADLELAHEPRTVDYDLADAAEPAPDEERAAGDASDLVALARLAADYAAFDSTATADGFLCWTEGALGSDPAPDSTDAVELSTFHRAKGLEWSTVFVTGLEDGFVPIAHARSAAALDEERRLLYVALTRATDELHCSWCASRTFGRRRSTRQPSPYLEALDAARRELDRSERPEPERARAAIAAARAQLAGARHDAAQHDSAQHDSAQHDSARLDSAQHDSARRQRGRPTPDRRADPHR